MTARTAYRPRPRNFREMFVQHGWATKEVFNARFTIIARWLDEEGRDDLIAERSAYLKARRSRRARNYVMGRRMGA